jgi:hypothetical protein
MKDRIQSYNWSIKIIYAGFPPCLYTKEYEEERLQVVFIKKSRQMRILKTHIPGVASPPYLVIVPILPVTGSSGYVLLGRHFVSRYKVPFFYLFDYSVSTKQPDSTLHLVMENTQYGIM